MRYEDFLTRLPAHEAGLILTHNPHKNMYETAEKYITDSYWQIDADDWVSEEERQKAIETGGIWELQWYPSTPVGFIRRYASTLAALLDSFPIPASVGGEKDSPA